MKDGSKDEQKGRTFYTLEMGDNDFNAGRHSYYDLPLWMEGENCNKDVSLRSKKKAIRPM